MLTSYWLKKGTGKIVIFYKCVKSNYLLLFADTGIPCFSKVCITSPHVYERPTFVPVYFNQKNSLEDIQFYKKRQKEKIAFMFVLHEPWGGRLPPPSSFPRELHSASWHQTAGLWTVFGSICALFPFILCIY